MANGLNKVILLGYAGKDAELKTFDSGAKKAQFTLATNETHKDKNGVYVTHTEWHNIYAWGTSAEYMSKYVKKGNQVLIEGSLRYHEFKDKEGITRQRCEIESENVTLLTKQDGEKSEKNTAERKTNAKEAVADGHPY